MENNPYYLRVGFFVIGFTAIFFIFSLWLSVGLSGVTYQTYFVYMKESVSGLSKKAPVKYNGVEVGYVADISLCKANPNLVQLTLSIDQRVPIYTTTYAVLETQGLTGIAYVGLKGGNIASPRLVPTKNQPYPAIQAGPSLMFRLSEALNDISKSLKTVLSPENTKAFTATLKNLEVITGDLKRNTKNLDVIMGNTAKASVNFPTTMESLKDGSKEATEALQNINNQLLPQMEFSMGNLETILSNTKDFSQQLSNNPSVLLRGKQPGPLGPGE